MMPAMQRRSWRRGNGSYATSLLWVLQDNMMLRCCWGRGGQCGYVGGGESGEEVCEWDYDDWWWVSMVKAPYSFLLLSLASFQNGLFQKSKTAQPLEPVQFFQFGDFGRFSAIWFGFFKNRFWNNDRTRCLTCSRFNWSNRPVQSDF